jgi:hypothetical protein
MVRITNHRNSVNIWLLGGFGNILFQILASRVLLANGTNIYLINSLTKKNIITKFIGWTIHEPLYTDFLRKNQVVKMCFVFEFAVIFVAMISKTLRIKFWLATFYDENSEFSKPFAKNVFGYFQNKFFLENHKDQLLLLSRDIRELYGSEPINVVVHYRFGDSVWAKENHNYYLKVREMIQHELSKVVIVTDSPVEASDFFLNCNNITISSSKNALDDFKILLSASKLYCAPSTFSWWAAHALHSKSHIVVPKLFRESLGIYVQGDRVVEL